MKHGHIQSYYASLSDSELIHITALNAKGIKPEVWPIIELELAKRNLDPELLENVRAQNKIYTEKELQIFAAPVRALPCPLCNSSAQPLNATIMHFSVGLIFFSINRWKLLIACPGCLDRRSTRNLILTTCLGWWGPLGPFKTPGLIYRNIKARQQHHLPVANKTLLDFTLGNIGILSTYSGEVALLQ